MESGGGSGATEVPLVQVKVNTFSYSVWSYLVLSTWGRLPHHVTFWGGDEIMTHYQVVRKTQCRLGYTESHTAAPGFGPGEVTEAAFLISMSKNFLQINITLSRPTSKYLLKIPTTWSNQLRATEGRSMQLDFWSVDFFYGGENGRIFQIHVHPFPTDQNDFPPVSILIKPKKTSQELQKMSLVTLDWKCHPKSYNLSIWWEHKCGISCQTNLIRNGNAVFKTGLFVQLDVKTFSEGTECSFDKTFAWKIQDHLLSFKWKSSGKSRMWFCGERPGSFVDKPVRATSVSPNWKTGKFAKNKNLMDVKWSISIPLWNVPPGANFVEAGPEELEGDRHRSLLHRCHPLHRCSQVPPHQPSKMNFNICGNFFHGQNFICTHA